jgi:uncharacterized membrane protein
MKMTGYDFLQNFWWVMPLVMIVFCFSMKKRCDVKTMCGYGSTGSKDIYISARYTLDQRYAQGEIDEREYEQKKKMLKRI